MRHELNCADTFRAKVLGGQVTPEQTLTLATIGLVVATVGLVAVTLLMWWEARRQRVEAVVIATVVPWDAAGGLYIAIQIENAGPAIAREIEIVWRLERKVDAVEGALREPLFGVGFRRTIVPIRTGTTMDQLAAEGASVYVELAWRDWRRGLADSQAWRRPRWRVRPPVDGGPP